MGFVEERIEGDLHGDSEEWIFVRLVGEGVDGWSFGFNTEPREFKGVELLLKTNGEDG